MKDDKKLKLIGSVPIFSRLRGRDLERVGQLVEEVDVPAGRVLMRQGESGLEFFLIVDGKVRVERDGRLLKMRGDGEFVGEIALIDEGPRSATVTCETACRLLVLAHREFVFLPPTVEGHRRLAPLVAQLGIQVEPVAVIRQALAP